jgi:hypothetical protein
VWYLPSFGLQWGSFNRQSCHPFAHNDKNTRANQSINIERNEFGDREETLYGAKWARLCFSRLTFYLCGSFGLRTAAQSDWIFGKAG